MANIAVVGLGDDQMDLPPGFRFHPTDEELISHYLYKKVLDINFSARAIGEVDLNKSEPWELPSSDFFQLMEGKDASNCAIVTNKKEMTARADRLGKNNNSVTFRESD